MRGHCRDYDILEDQTCFNPCFFKASIISKCSSRKKKHNTKAVYNATFFQNTELKKLAEAPPGEGDPCAARLKLQFDDFTAKINDYKTEIENLNMKVLRMGILEKSLKNTNDQINQLKQENLKLTENIRVFFLEVFLLFNCLLLQMAQLQSVSATDVESKPGPSSASKSVSSIRQTPTKVLDPLSSAAKQPNEPDQTTGLKTSQQPPSFAAKRPSFGRQAQSSSNVIPPAPAPTPTSQQKVSPVKRPIPPSIPNEPLDIIPPVPSDNIPGMILVV